MINDNSAYRIYIAICIKGYSGHPGDPSDLIGLEATHTSSVDRRGGPQNFWSHGLFDGHASDVETVLSKAIRSISQHAPAISKFIRERSAAEAYINIAVGSNECVPLYLEADVLGVLANATLDLSVDCIPAGQ